MEIIEKLPDLNNKKTLIVRVDKIGSILFATPFMHALRESYPQAYIDGLFAKVQAQVMKYSVDIDNLYTYDKKNILAFLSTLLKLRKNKYDYILVMSHNSKTASNIVRFIPATKKIVIAHVKPFFHSVYDYQVELPQTCVVAEYYAALSQNLGLKIHSAHPLLPISDMERNTMAKVFPKNGKRIVFFIGNLDPKKQWHRWQAEKYAELVQRTKHFFENKSIQGEIIVMAGVRDMPLLDDFKSIPEDIYKVYIGTNIHETAALLEQADLLVCGSTGPAHIGAAVDCQVMSIVSKIDHECWTPFGANNFAVIAETGSVQDINTETVFRRLEEVLAFWK